jgi:hypothetical protein
MRHLYLLSLLLFSLAACSEEARPYEEVNTTLSQEEQGHIQTH